MSIVSLVVNAFIAGVYPESIRRGTRLHHVLTLKSNRRVSLESNGSHIKMSVIEGLGVLRIPYSGLAPSEHILTQDEMRKIGHFLTHKEKLVSRHTRFKLERHHKCW
jgi:hypothetical protein